MALSLTSNLAHLSPGPERPDKHLFIVLTRVSRQTVKLTLLSSPKRLKSRYARPQSTTTKPPAYPFNKSSMSKSRGNKITEDAPFKRRPYRSSIPRLSRKQRTKALRPVPIPRSRRLGEAVFRPPQTQPQAKKSPTTHKNRQPPEKQRIFNKPRTQNSQQIIPNQSARSRDTCRRTSSAARWRTGP